MYNLYNIPVLVHGPWNNTVLAKGNIFFNFRIENRHNFIIINLEKRIQSTGIIVIKNYIVSLLPLLG